MIGNKWDEILKEEYQKDYFKQLTEFVEKEYETKTIYPKKEDIFAAFKYTDYDDVRVVLLGQDPYHGVNQAHGLCFSVQKGVAQPPSLKNIFKELQEDLGCRIPSHGNLIKWANEGVLMLNTVLTVREGNANSHANKGWEKLTDSIICKLNESKKPIVFLLWGRNAQSKMNLITNPNHLILKCAHPSPLSAYNGFYGCRHFSKTNNFLMKNGYKPIDWQIEE